MKKKKKKQYSREIRNKSGNSAVCCEGSRVWAMQWPLAHQKTHSIGLRD